MNKFVEQQLDQAVETSNIEFTKLADMDLHRVVADDHKMVPVTSGQNWRAQIESLVRTYPDLERTSLALAVLATYLCRTSEDQEATFRVVNTLIPSAESYETAVSMGIQGRETYAEFTERLAVQQVQSLVVTGTRTTYNREKNPHLVVTVGRMPENQVFADLHLHISEKGDLECHIASYLDYAYGERMHERLTALARSISRDPFKPLAFHSIMSPLERELVTNVWNDTAVYYPYEGGLVGMMQRSAENNPDHPAVVFKDEAVSFGEFNARVNHLARKLVDLGVGKDDFVCICMERSIELVVAIWAVVKAGGAYVPLNTEDPEARIEEIILDCQPKAVLTQERLLDKLPCDAPRIVVREGGVDDGEWNRENLDFLPDPDALAYMIYTSGSTGKPKGVTVEHEAIHNRVVWMHEEYGLLPEDRILQKTPYTFDVSVWEFFWSFAVGSTLVVAEPNGHVAMRYLYEVMDSQKVTHLHFVPSVMRLFLMLPDLDQLPIKKLFCSGEALGFDSVETFYAKANDYAEVHNLYGPTEAAVDVSYFHCPRKPSDTMIPIGKPVANTSLYVLDENYQPLPVGVPGELHIGGVQLARGYWAREELTRERFVVPDFLTEVPHKRLYKTGDLAFFRPDGEIVYLGRNDFQVKINGVRMELGEIEAVIRADEDTRDVVVVAEETAGNKTLTAYVVSDQPGNEKAESLKQLIAASRPPYYVPRDIKFLAEMPLTVSGKINRKILADQKVIGC